MLSELNRAQPGARRRRSTAATTNRCSARCATSSSTINAVSPASSTSSRRVARTSLARSRSRRRRASAVARARTRAACSCRPRRAPARARRLVRRRRRRRRGALLQPGRPGRHRRLSRSSSTAADLSAHRLRPRRLGRQHAAGRRRQHQLPAVPDAGADLEAAQQSGAGSPSASASGCRTSASTRIRRTARSATRNISINGSLLGVVRSWRRRSASRALVWLGVGLQNMVLQLQQPRHAVGLLGAQLRARRSRLRLAHRGSTPIRRSRRRASSARPSRSTKFRAGAHAAAAVLRALDGHGALARCRAIRSSPTRRGARQRASASTSTLPLIAARRRRVSPVPSAARRGSASTTKRGRCRRTSPSSRKGIYIDGVPGIGNYYLNTLHVHAQHAGHLRACTSAASTEAFKRRRRCSAPAISSRPAPRPTRPRACSRSDGLHNMITHRHGRAHARPVRFDLGYGTSSTTDRTVTNSQSLQQNPIQPALAVPVGNGHYKFDTDILSVGLEAPLLAAYNL